MLARRFVIICLIASAMAFALISLIEQSGGAAYSWKLEASTPCVFERPKVCAIPHQK